MKTKLFTFILATLGLVLIGCNDDKATWLVKTTDGPMTITRVADPKNSDITIVAGALDQLIKIEGTNLNNVETVFINDVQAVRPSYMLPINGAIYVRVPYEAPVVRDDKIKLTDKQGRTVETSFDVTVPELVVTKMECEYTPEGARLTIIGDYLDMYHMKSGTGTIMFGSIAAPIVSGTKTTAVAVVPQGVPDNTTLTLVSDKTTAVCPGKYMDKECVIIDFETTSGLYALEGAVYISGPNDTSYPSVTAAGDTALPTDPNGISGKYLRYKGLYMGGWNFQQLIYKNFTPPADFVGNQTTYALKFECYAVTDLNSYYVAFESNASTSGSTFRWGLDPEFKVGKWQTYTIPLSDFPNPSAWNSVFKLVFNAHAGYMPIKDMYFCVDNFRISKLN